MKIVLLFLIDIVFNMRTDAVCDSLFLQSFGLQGRAVPHSINSLCPLL